MGSTCRFLVEGRVRVPGFSRLQRACGVPVTGVINVLPTKPLPLSVGPLPSSRGPVDAPGFSVSRVRRVNPDLKVIATLRPLLFETRRRRIKSLLLQRLLEQAIRSTSPPCGKGGVADLVVGRIAERTRVD